MQSPPPYGFEPSLTEALDDPIIQQMMTSDGVSRDDVMRLVEPAREATTTREWVMVARSDRQPH
jgi:succinyl-CoA synthetase alpha subunit